MISSRVASTVPSCGVIVYTDVIMNP